MFIETLDNNKFKIISEKFKQNKEKSESKKIANFEGDIQTDISSINTLDNSKSNAEPVTEFEGNEGKVDMRIELILNHNNDLKDSVFDINENETKPKAEITINLTNLVENVETVAGLDVLKNVIEASVEC